MRVMAREMGQRGFGLVAGATAVLATLLLPTTAWGKSYVAVNASLVERVGLHQHFFTYRAR
jgi:hypothetical protein